ncbi:MAG: tetratricopeptide repeat protein [Bacteroidia bacterium]
MLKHYNSNIYLKVLPLVLLMGCAGFRESKLGKFHNNMTARYNGYFNAKELVLASKHTVEEAHEDDFTKVLDVYRWGNDATGKSQASTMDKSIEKCSEVIQNHEGSQWIDDAYFTVAQAYFYKADYYAAIDLFKWLANEYKGEDMEAKARIWIVKTYVQMEKINDAQAYMSNIQNEKRLFEDYKTEIELVNAQLKIEANNTTEAARSLERAIPEMSNRKEKNRCKFILAQLYEEIGYNSKAHAIYLELLRKNMPYEFQFQTRINVAKSTNLKNKENAEKVVKSFKKLLRDDNNIDYFDKIHYEIANVYLESGNKQKAIEHYKISAFLGKDNFNQKANTYLALGDLYFNDDNFEPAGLYYDSCANVVPENHPEYEKIKKQQEILGDLIKNLATIKTQDSLQQLSSLEIEEIEKIIDKKIVADSIAAVAAAEKEELRKKKEELMKNLNESSIANAPNMRNTGGDWYFYNPVAIGKGLNDFRREWGGRKLEDNWRRSEKQYVFTGDGNEEDSLGLEEEIDDSLTIAENEDPALTPEMLEKLNQIDESKRIYFDNIPFLPAQKRASDNLITEALYNNGLIYYEKLGDLNSAVKSFNILLNDFSGSKFEAAAHFYLYKIFLDQGNEEEAELHKEIILKDFAKSQYATLILGGGDFDEVKNNPMLERLYNLAYSYYEQGKCDSVAKTYSTATRSVDDNYLRDKFEFLTTLCNGKGLDTDSFIYLLNAYSSTYSTSETSKEARNLARYLEASKPKPQEKTDSTGNENTEVGGPLITKEFDFSQSTEGDFYFIMVSNDEELKVPRLKSEIANYNILYHRSEALSIKSLEFTDGETLFWVKTFPSYDKAMKYYNGITTDDEFKAKVKIDSASMFYISTDNFKMLISEQNTSEYLEFFDLYFVKKEN